MLRMWKSVCRDEEGNGARTLAHGGGLYVLGWSDVYVSGRRCKDRQGYPT